MATATASSPTDGPPLAPRLPHARSMCPIRSSCSATQINAPTSPTACVPTVRVALRSATGASVAGPSTDWRANGTAPDRVPHRLGGDAVAAAIHLPFEYMHIFHVA